MHVADHANSHLANVHALLHSVRGVFDIARRLTGNKGGRARVRTLDLMWHLIESHA
jgi:hypothetical protein